MYQSGARATNAAVNIAGHMDLCASPRLPPNHELLTLIPPIGTKEFVAYLLAYTEAAKAVGPTRNFVLVGQL
jgi:hypothetical protein